MQLGRRSRTLGPWLRDLVPVPDPRCRWICLPHGGAGVSAFASWSPHVAADTHLMAVQYPGREDRWDEPPVRDLRTMAAHVAAAIGRLPQVPLVLIGHSLGAMLGYEVIRRLTQRSPMAPTLFVASGHEPPYLMRRGDIHRRDDHGLAAEIRRVGGNDPAALGDVGLARHLYAALREDYRMIETYEPESALPLGVPIAAFAGAEDPDLSHADLAAWSAVTHSFRGVQTFPGTHLYDPDAVPALVAAVARLEAELYPR